MIESQRPGIHACDPGYTSTMNLAMSPMGPARSKENRKSTVELPLVSADSLNAETASSHRYCFSARTERLCLREVERMLWHPVSPKPLAKVYSDWKQRARQNSMSSRQGTSSALGMHSLVLNSLVGVEILNYKTYRRAGTDIEYPEMVGAFE